MRLFRAIRLFIYMTRKRMFGKSLRLRWHFARQLSGPCIHRLNKRLKRIDDAQDKAIQAD